MRSRQLARVSAPQYHETLFSLLFPGNTPSSSAFQPVVLELERQMGWAPNQRHQTVLRSDGGCGTDGNINWQLWRNYQIMTKGFSGKRAVSQAQNIQTWSEVRPGLWVAAVVQPHRYGRRTTQFVRRWMDERGQFRYALQIHSLASLSLAEAVHTYDERGAIEGEFQSDKHGLHLAQRRKRQLSAQEALVLLTDLAHSTVAWLHPWMFVDSPFAQWGPTRVIRDLFSIPGDVVLKEGRLVKVALSQRHPYASAMAICLTKLLRKLGTPVS